MKYFIFLAALAISQSSESTPATPSSSAVSLSVSVQPTLTTSAPVVVTSTSAGTSTSQLASSSAIASPASRPASSVGATRTSGNPSTSPTLPSTGGTDQPDPTNQSQPASSSFSLGVPAMFAIGAAVLAILFSAIAFYIIRRRKPNNESALMDLGDPMGKGPAPLNGPGGAIKILGDEPDKSTLNSRGPNSSRDIPIQHGNSATFDIANYYSAPSPDRGPVYTQREIDIWNAQQQFGMYTSQQVEDWAAQMQNEGYSDAQVEAWKNGLGRTFTQAEIESWYDLEYFPQSQTTSGADYINARDNARLGPKPSRNMTGNSQG